MTTAPGPTIEVCGDVTAEAIDALADLLLAIVEADQVTARAFCNLHGLWKSEG